MARPAPTIICESCDPISYKTEQILAADAVYAVYYKDTPINIKTVNKLYNMPPKYKKTSFQNPGYALCLAKRLNELFSTTDFVVRQMIGGDVYTGKVIDFYGDDE